MPTAKIGPHTGTTQDGTREDHITKRSVMKNGMITMHSMIHVAHHNHDTLYIFVTWVFDGFSKLTENGAAKHGSQEDVEHTPEKEELADAAVHL